MSIFIVVLSRTMEDSDVITRTQLVLAGGAIAAGEETHEKPKGQAKGESIRIYLCSGSYAQRTSYSAVRVITAYFLDRRQFGKIFKEHVACAIIEAISSGYYVAT